MLPPICSSLLVLLLLSGYRLLWLRRYGKGGLEGSFARLQGRVAYDATENDVLLLRSKDGELLRRPFELQLKGGGRCKVDLRSPWLRVLTRLVRRGQLITVDGVATVLARPEALYREPSQQTFLEALRIAPGAWPEMRLLRLPWLIALLVLLVALSLPHLVTLPARDDALAGTQLATPPVTLPPLACPAGTRAWEDVERTCRDDAGLRRGPAETRDQQGQLLESGQYRQDRRDGVWLRYHANGLMAARTQFIMGNAEGCWERWTEAGALQARQCYKQGKLDGPSALWQDGLHEQGSYERGLKQGLWEVRSEEGVLLRRGDYRVGRRHGSWHFWTEDGGPAARGRYGDGMVDGPWTWWHETGHLAGRGRYVKGLKQGRWRSWYPGGGKRAELDYCDDVSCGRHRVWRE